MQMRRSEAGQGGGWGCGPEQLAATEPCAVHSGCIAMLRRTQPLAMFCRYSEVLELYVRDNVIIGKISPDRAYRTPTRSKGVLLRLEGAYFR